MRHGRSSAWRRQERIQLADIGQRSRSGGRHLMDDAGSIADVLWRCRCVIRNFVQRSWSRLRSRRRCDLIAWHGRWSCSRCRRSGWLWRRRRLSRGNHLLGHLDMRACRIEALCDAQESLGLGQPHPGRRIDSRRDEYPIRPGLRDHGIRLHPIQDVLPLLGCLLCLLCGRGLCQGLIRCVEVLLELVIFLS